MFFFFFVRPLSFPDHCSALPRYALIDAMRWSQEETFASRETLADCERSEKRFLGRVAGVFFPSPACRRQARNPPLPALPQSRRTPPRHQLKHVYDLFVARSRLHANQSLDYLKYAYLSQRYS